MAEQNRYLFEKQELLVINLLSSPGSGKTALIGRMQTEQQKQKCDRRFKIGVIVGDLATDNDARSVHAYVIGEHGDSEIPVWSTANVAGHKLLPHGWENLKNSDRQELTDLFNRVKNAAYEIIHRKGYTSYAIGLVVTDIVIAILRSQDRVLTVSSLVDGLYGIDNVCLGLPRVVNEQGILKTVNLDLSLKEEKQLHHSAQVLKEVFNNLDL